MLEKEKLVREIRKAFANLTADIYLGGKLNHLDANVQSETFVQVLLNAVYGWQLVSTNQATANYPCIDLIDVAQKLGLQVSSDGGSGKINDTLACLAKNGLAGTIASLKVFVLGEKQGKYTIKTHCAGVSFDWVSDVLDFEDVLKAVNNLPDDQLRTVHRYVVEAMPDIFPDYRAAPPRQPDFSIRDHHNAVRSVGSESRQWMGPAIKPNWLDSEPDRMGSAWIVAKLSGNVPLDLYIASGWGDQGTWFVVDRQTRDGVVLNHDQFRELRQVSATTTTTAAPTPQTGGSDGHSSASALLQNYRELYAHAGPEKEDALFLQALRRGEADAKETHKGKIILLTAVVEQHLAKTTGLTVSSQSRSDFGILRAELWARELRAFRTDLDRQVAGTESMAPAYDRLEHVHRAVTELRAALTNHAAWSDSAEKFAPGTRDSLDALLGRVAALAETTVQTRPKRFITVEELTEAKWVAAECTRIATEVERGMRG